MTLKRLDESKYSIQSRLIYGRSYTGAWDFKHHVIPPVTTSSAFRLDTAARGAEGFGAFGKIPSADSTSDPIYLYDRMGEPNTDLLQDALSMAEGGESCVTFSTGMAAVHAATAAFVKMGDEIVSHSSLYGPSFALLSKWYKGFGITTHFCDFTVTDEFVKHVNANTRLVYLESPVNPTMNLIDTEAVAKKIAELNKGRPEEKQILTVIDNTFASPFAQRPIEKGIDVVLHSLTKAICGFGTEMGGAVITRRALAEKLLGFRKDFGASLSPASAWHILTYGLSTLCLRVPKQQENASKIAAYLNDHPKVERVFYPGLSNFPQYDLAQRILQDYDGNFAPGFMLYFIIKGSSNDDRRKAGGKMMDFLASEAYTVTLAVSLGQLRTLVQHPASMTHTAYSSEEQIKLGIDPGGIRLAVGLEDPDDVIKDLERSLAAV